MSLPPILCQLVPTCTVSTCAQVCRCYAPGATPASEPRRPDIYAATVFPTQLGASGGKSPGPDAVTATGLGNHAASEREYRRRPSSQIQISFK